MPASINKLITYHPDTYLINPTLRNVLSQHIDYLRKHPTTQRHVVDVELATPHYFDLYGYLHNVGIATELHWPILILNMASPYEFTNKTKELLIPDISQVNEIISVANSY